LGEEPANLDQNFVENPNLGTCRESVTLSDFLNVIKLSPTHASAYYCIARIYEKQGYKALAGEYYLLAREYLSGLHREYFERKHLGWPEQNGLE
jgi:hypothetical protein